MDSEQITYIGKTDFRNKLTKFGIKAKDRTKHMYVIGKTGTGKSTFLENMIVQDIQNGNGIAFIDPHGGSAEKLLDYVPEWRLEDVIYFNPSDFEFPIAFNPLEDPGPEKRHLVADGLMSVFKKVWPDAFSGRMEYILNTTMMSLLEYPDSTILSINRMLTDKDFRKKVVAATTDSAVKNAWDELMKWDDKRWSEAVAALINKVGQFSTNPVIRNIVGQSKSTFDFRKAMDERKIIIINLSKGMIGEQNAPLLGAMLITKIYLAAMSRAEMPSHVLEKAAPFYFYVDEFQNFANESFASILSEARKYKLALTVANQFIAQMEETIRDAVFGNMGTTAAFRVGPLDAEFMERVFAPVFTQEDLQNIAFGQLYLTLQIDGMGSKPFSAQGLGPIAPLPISLRNNVIEASRTRYGRPREEVESSIKKFFGYDQKDAKVITSVDVNNQSVKTISKNNSGSQNIQQNISLERKNEKKDTVFKQKPSNLISKIPEISGFKKNAVIQTPQPKKEKPLSDTLNNLLEQLDSPSSELVPAAVRSVQEPQKPFVSTIIPHSSVARPVKELTRAASPEKKSALAEALAKAMGANPKQGGGSINFEKDEISSSEKIETKPIITKGSSSPSPKMTVIPPRQETKQVSQTPREIPEDILRSVLE